MSQENVQTVQRVLDTLRYTTTEELTDGLLEELFAPDVEWLPVGHSLLTADRYVGYEGIRRFFAFFLAMWDEFGADLETFQEVVHEVGDRVVTTLRVKGRRPGVILDEGWSAVWTVANDRVVRMEGFASPSGASEAVGLAE